MCFKVRVNNYKYNLPPFFLSFFLPLFKAHEPTSQVMSVAPAPSTMSGGSGSADLTQYVEGTFKSTSDRNNF